MVKCDICDLHSHILPDMDDGCKTAEESLQVLQESAQQGIAAMFATPHYYPVEPVDAFLARREAAWERLSKAIPNGAQQIPQLCLGAEVAYRPGLCYEEKLSALCLGSSRYMLLELPFSRWNREMLRDIRNICSVKGITPILAHIERYLSIQTRDMLEQVLELDVLAQMNTESLLRFGQRRRNSRLLENGTVQLLGSDCHNTRPQNMQAGIAYLEKRSLYQQIDRAAEKSMDIFREASGK